MVKTKTAGTGCASAPDGTGCCQVESVATVDERGQMVLPKETREKAGIKPGDKLAVVSWRKEGRVCCLTLIKTDELAGMVRDFMGPMMEDLAAK